MKSETSANKPALSKVDLGKIKDVAKKPLTKVIMKNLSLALYSYLIVLALGQILISGGMSDRSPYYIITVSIILVASQILLIRNKFYENMKTTITASILSLILFALLDYLLVNLVLLKNNYEFYKFWPNFIIYALVVGLPFIRSKWRNVSSFNPKSLLTKQGRTL